MTELASLQFTAVLEEHCSFTYLGIVLLCTPYSDCFMCSRLMNFELGSLLIHQPGKFCDKK